MDVIDKSIVDITFDFTTDTPDYWDRFWVRKNGLGVAGNDPDALSPTLKKYQKALWSKELPNGEIMDLTIGHGYSYLTWKDFRFGSDSIPASFRYHKYRKMITQIKEIVPNYNEFIENFLHETYTIGGEIIFPKRRYRSINQRRGCKREIQDRWDLTLECIRRYYQDESSPLYDTLLNEKEFFDLFIDFKGYVDFFFLQDCVSDDYQTVKFWLGNGEFTPYPLPQTVDDYLLWIDKNLEFVRKRNKRIQEYCSK